MRCAIAVFICLALFTRCNNEQASNQSVKAKVSWKSAMGATPSHLRGLDVTKDATIWASGTDGEVLRSIDQGETWTSYKIPNCDGLDFRDLEGFDRDHAAVMSSGNGVRLYYTNDGGLSWRLSYQDTNRHEFFDGMDFNGARGLAYGDPQDGKLALIESIDSGKSWTAANRANMPPALEGEAGFAASGTGIVLGKSAIWIATGAGATSRVFRATADSVWTAIESPLESAPSSGIFSMAFANDEQGIIVGGDYVDSTRNTLNAAYTLDGGINWLIPETNPSGYRSCVTFSEDGSLAVATGRSGTDYSMDQGKNWKLLSNEGYFSCVIVENYLIGVGRNGKIGRMDISSLIIEASRE